MKSLLSDYYSSEELSVAKELLMTQVDSLNLQNFPKIVRQRRNSVGRSGHELDDMFTVLVFIDENKQLDRLPRFVATSPDKIPSPRLVEGDVSVLWEKLSRLQEAIFAVQQSNEAYTKISKENTVMLHSVVKEIRDIGIAHKDIKDTVYNAQRAVQVHKTAGLHVPTTTRHVGHTVDNRDGSTCITHNVRSAGSNYVNIATASQDNNIAKASQSKRWGSSNAAQPADSESETRDNNDGYSIAQSRKNMRAAKRKDRDSNQSSPTQDQQIAKKSFDGSRSYEFKVQRRG